MRQTAIVKKCIIYLLFSLLILSLLSGCNSEPTTEAKIRETLKTFENDLNDCMDFSNFLEGRKIRFTSLDNYFDNDNAYKIMSEYEQHLDDTNLHFLHYNQLIMSYGTSFAGDVLGGIAGGLLGSLIGDTLGNSLGSTLGKSISDTLKGISEEEIANDVLYDEAVWKGMADVTIKILKITVAPDEQSAEAEMDWIIRIDGTPLNDSRVVKLLKQTTDPDFTLEKETWELHAEMEINRYGDWVFTSLIKN